mmetsp:Transcript_76239/g.217838  ORF Transcript_76239/g.217838 Transcript_76239/m.217838 type:complete len:418 (-) Transcript_76239:1360-2613(-)
MSSASSLVASRSAALATHLSASGWWYWSHGMPALRMFFVLPLSGCSSSLQPARAHLHSFLKLPIPISSEEQSKVGVIAASAGNHALALAWHGKQMGIPVTVLMPTLAPLAKVSRCRAFGANVVIHGANIGEAKLLAETDPEFAGLQYINGYDDPEIVAGAGTMGLEILEQLPEADFVIIPCGGAGLLAGSALAIKTLKPTCHVIGVEPKRCASFLAALEAGEPVAAPTTPTLADGLAVPTVGGNAFLVAREYADDIEQVGEHEIALAMLRLIESEKLVVEGGGAAGLAAILPGGPLHHKVQGKRVVVPLCGGNIDTTTLGRVIDRGLAADERLVRFVAQVSDQPGGIAGLTKLLADEGGSIKDIYHERAWLQTSISNVQAKVNLLGGTTERDHAGRIDPHSKAKPNPKPDSDPLTPT